MKEWWENITLSLKPSKKGRNDKQKQLDLMKNRLQSLLHQQDSICNLLEKGVYTEEMFMKRNISITTEISDLKIKH